MLTDKCTLCEAHKQSKSNCLKGWGSETPDILFIGSHPGREEDQSGKEFSGDSGKVLIEFLKQIGFDLSKCRFCNTVRCSPKEANGYGREPTKEEISTCSQFTIEDIKKYKPKIVVPLGNAALSIFGLTGANRLSGTIKMVGEMAVIPCINPASVIYDSSNLSLLVDSLHKVFKYSRGELVEEPKNYQIIKDPKVLKDLIEYLKTRPRLCFDIETTHKKPYEIGFNIYCMAIAESPGTVYGIPMFHKDSPFKWQRYYWLYQDLANLMAMKTKKWYGHNLLKFDKPGIEKVLGIKMHTDFQDAVDRFDDTMMMHYALDERRGTHDLETLAIKFLGWRAWSIDTKTFENDPIDYILEYCCEDVDVNVRLDQKFTELLVRDSDKYGVDLTKTYKGYLLENAVHCMYLDGSGVQPNVDYANALEETWNSVIVQLDAAIHTLPEVAGFCKRKHTKEQSKFKKKIVDIKDIKFEPTSDVQLRDLLFRDMGAPYDREILGMTDGGKQKVGWETLEWLKKTGFRTDVVSILQKYREICDGLSDYVLPTKRDVQRYSNGLIHAGFMPHGTETGRYSGKDPNLQKVARDTTIKMLYTTRYSDGFLVETDGAAAEIRWSCCHAGNPNGALAQLFKTGEDLHSTISVMIRNMALGTKYTKETLPKEIRTSDKDVTLGRMYKRSARAIAQKFGLRVEAFDAIHQSKRFGTLIPQQYQKDEKLYDTIIQCVKAWDDRFPEFGEWHKRVEKSVRKNGYIASLFGLVRRLPGVFSVDDEEVHKAVREAINAGPQGDSHRWVAMAMQFFIREYVEKMKLKGVVWNDVHDSGMSDAPRAELDVHVIGHVEGFLRPYFMKEQYPFIICDLGCEVKIQRPYGNMLAEYKFDTAMMKNKEKENFNLREAIAEMYFAQKKDV